MNCVISLCVSLLLLQCAIPGCCMDPVSGFAAGFAAVGSLFYTGFDAIRCRFASCCNDRWIKKDIAGLEREVNEKLYGQHLVQKTVIGHIKGHLRSDNPSKALVLSFHGLPGVGKNFVSKIIAENLYKDGLRSPFVHLMLATRDFPHAGMVPFYKEQLKSWIESNVTRCERSMFIIDEVDKIPAGLLDVLKPYIDFYEHLEGVNYRKAIFVLLSNSGGSDIGKLVWQHWTEGHKREDLNLKQAENIAMLSAVNSDDHHGLWHSHLIASHLITAYIPFLPLEKRHVRKCVKDAVMAKRKCSNRNHILDSFVDKVIQELTFYPETEQIFSTSGCKRVSEKVDYVLLDEKVCHIVEKHPEL